MSTFGKCKGGGRRAAHREIVPLIATFRTISRIQCALVVDVSATGVRLSGEGLPPRGEVLEVSIEGLRAFGTVVWCADGECGIEFDEPLCTAHVNLLRHRVTLQAGLPPQIRAAMEDWMTGMAR